MDLAKFLSLLLCAIAVGQDLRSRRVSNRVLIVGLLVYSLSLLATRGIENIGQSGLSFLAVLGIGFIFWRFKVLGAGDVKLLAILSLGFPWQRSLEFVFYSFVWGGLIGVVSLLLDKGFIQEARALNFHPIMSIRTSRARNHKIPFTVSILMGLLSTWVLLEKGVFFL